MTITKLQLRNSIKQLVREAVKKHEDAEFNTDAETEEEPAFGAEESGEEEGEASENPFAGGEEPHGEEPSPEGHRSLEEFDEAILIKMLSLIVKRLEAIHAEEPAGDVGGDADSIDSIVDEIPFDEPAEPTGEEPEADLDEAAYKQVSQNATDTAKERKAFRIQREPKVSENFKVQTRSYKTVNDLPNNPKNVRDPKVPR